MLNNNISFNIVNEEIKTKEIPSTDLEVPAEDTFSINWTGDGFTISPFRNSDYIIGLPALSNNNLSPRPSSTTSTSAQWTLRKYSGVEQYGFGLYSYEFPLFLRKDGVFRTAIWSTQIGCNMPRLSVMSGYQNFMKITWNDNTRTGAFELSKSGKLGVECKIINENSVPLYTIPHYINVYPIEEGTYFIQNAQTQKYVTSDAYNENQNVEVQNIGAGQWVYENQIYQTWDIEYIEYCYEYITIKSPYSGGYLGVDSSGTSIKQYNSVNDYCTWKLETTIKENFKLTCKAFEENENVLAFTSYENGDRLIQNTYQHNSAQLQLDYDEWYLVKKVISMVNYYDSDFINNHSQLLPYIEKAVSFANLVYSRYYNIGIYIDGQPTLKHTSFDECYYDSSVLCDNNCGEDCFTQHHKNTVRIANQIYYNESRENKHIYVLWTNPENAYCTIENGEHKRNPKIAVSRNYIPVILFLSFFDSSYSSEKILTIMSVTLIHEIAHVIGMDEPYETIPDHTENGNIICAMTKINTSTINIHDYNRMLNNVKPAFCQNCNSKIREYTTTINNSDDNIFDDWLMRGETYEN